MVELQVVHQVADSPGSAIGQWFNAGGMIQFYDYPLETYLNVKSFPIQIVELVLTDF